tara:strand:- start:3442 stop:3708 length:267 start_codon:yes stop_codon:yes gene_type:complete
MMQIKRNPRHKTPKDSFLFVHSCKYNNLPARKYFISEYLFLSRRHQPLFFDARVLFVSAFQNNLNLAEKTRKNFPVHSFILRAGGLIS